MAGVSEELEIARREAQVCFWCTRSARWVRATGMGDQQGACAEHVDDDPAWRPTAVPDSIEVDFVIRVGSGLRDGLRVWVAESAGQQRLGRTPQDALGSLARNLPEAVASVSGEAATGPSTMRAALLRIAVYARSCAEFETERGMEGAARTWRHVWSTATEPLDEKAIRELGGPP